MLEQVVLPLAASVHKLNNIVIIAHIYFLNVHFST
jgi:hypothetical protein